MTRTTMATTTRSASTEFTATATVNAFPTFQAPTHSVEQVLILDHVATLLQWLMPRTASNGDNDSVNPQNADVNSKNIVARINKLLELYTCYC